MLNLNDNIFYVGVRDTDAGAYNNAYLVKGEKTALIDTVSEKLSQSYIKNIEKFISADKIDYLVCNHSEPDKSGAVKHILELNPDIEIIGTIAALKNLKEITNMTFNEHVAKEGAVLDLGNGTELQFCIVPNLNWPDTMVTYETKSKTLFSCDIFSAYYDCDITSEDVVFEDYENALKEYYNLCFSPFKAFAERAAEKISSFDIRRICTGYGPAIETKVNRVVDDYKEWSSPYVSDTKTAVIFHSSKYGSTSGMAEEIKSTLENDGISVKVFDKVNGETIEALNNSDAIIFGTPTINKNAADDIWKAVSSLNSVIVKGKPYFVFGSYGWSGEGIQLVHKHLEMMKLKPFDKPFGVLMSPSDADIDKLKGYTKRFSDMLQNI